MEGNPIRILVIDRGFVIVCRCPDPEGFGFWLPVTDSRTIRRWGTTNGLGELIDGPLSGTVLDALVLKETVSVRAILRVIDVEQAKWEPHLSSGKTVSRAGSSRRTGMPITPGTT